MKKLISADTTDIFGKITPPQGVPGAGNSNEALNNFLSFGLRTFFVAAGLVAAVYMFWGAFDWITSGGEKEKVGKAQNKVQNAVIGLVLIFALLAVIGLFERTILHICFGITCKINLTPLNK